jgi:hypothetical protein
VRLHADNAESERMMQKMFTDTFKLLMMNEFEIIHFVKYLKNFALEANGFLFTISFIALATKKLLNDEKVMTAIETFLNLNYSVIFIHFNSWISINNHLMKTKANELYMSQKIRNKLREGMLPPFDYE